MVIKSFAIVPAAGHSRRMGSDKLLLPWPGSRNVLGATLSRWLASRVSQVVVVARADQREVHDVCRGIPRVNLVIPDEAPAEMKNSVLAALACIGSTFAPADSDVWLLAPGDMPRLSYSVVNLLLDTHNPAAPAILKPTIRGRHGHPVLFPWSAAQHVSNMPAEYNLHHLASLVPVREVGCCDPAILNDIDTPQDYWRDVSRLESASKDHK
jgi:molybdenum cofactor cytidylyltransferase